MNHVAAEPHPWFGNRVRQERERRGWSMTDLATRSGLAVATIHAAEHGNDPRLSTVLLIAQTMRVSVDLMLRPDPGTPVVRTDLTGQMTEALAGAHLFAALRNAAAHGIITRLDDGGMALAAVVPPDRVIQ